MTLQAVCPECDAVVRFSTNPQRGQRVVCASCRSALAVINVQPLRLDWAFIEPISPFPAAEGEVLQTHETNTQELQEFQKRSEGSFHGHGQAELSLGSEDEIDKSSI
jgi:lysine biosynthesis protein LysW